MWGKILKADWSDSHCHAIATDKILKSISAPELLEACKAAKAIFEAQGISSAHRIGGDQYDLICKAIKKAES